MNLLMMAKCHLKLKNKDAARENAEKALTLPVDTEEDKGAHQEAEEMLRKL